MRAAVYTRISDDKLGQRAGVERQRADCEALVATRGWELVDTYEDNSRSAYNGKARPEYERLLADVGAGKVDAGVCWHQDRLWRDVI